MRVFGEKIGCLGYSIALQRYFYAKILHEKGIFYSVVLTQTKCKLSCIYFYFLCVVVVFFITEFDMFLGAITY